MDFFKLWFFTPERSKFSYALTVTTVHETNVLSSSKEKKRFNDILLVKLGFTSNTQVKLFVIKDLMKISHTIILIYIMLLIMVRNLR